MWTDGHDEDNSCFSQFFDVTYVETTKKWGVLSALFNDNINL
jgi:hypothetical protein